MGAFDRTAQLLGTFAVEKLASSSVAVFGLGGVGSYAAEALARAGVGRLLLVDADGRRRDQPQPPARRAAFDGRPSQGRGDARAGGGYQSRLPCRGAGGILPVPD